MDKEKAQSRINRIFYGALIWAVFYVYVYAQPHVWDNETLLGAVFNIAYSKEIAEIFKIGFFIFFGFNLYKTILGKTKGYISYNRLMNILILAAVIKLAIQVIAFSLLDDDAFMGLFGYLFNTEARFYQSSYFLLYLIGNVLELLTFMMIIIFYYQLKKSHIHLPTMITLRIWIIALLFGYTFFINNLVEHNIVNGIVNLFYLSIIMIVYVKTRYNFALTACCMVLLILI